MHVWSERVTEPAWWIAVGVCCVWLFVRWTLRRIKRHGNRLSEDEPRCARCGYIIFPGASSICPECGTDVRENGLLTPSTPMPSTSTPWVVLAVLLAWPLASWLAPHVAERQPFGWAYSASRRIEFTESGATAFIDSFGTGRYWRREPYLIKARIHNGPVPKAPYLFITPSDKSSFASDGAMQSWQLRFDDHAVSSLVALAGFAPDTPIGRHVANQIRREIDVMWVGDVPPPLPDDDTSDPTAWGRTGVHYRLRDRVVQVVASILWGILSSGVMVLGTLWHRRKRKRAAAARAEVIHRMAFNPALQT